MQTVDMAVIGGGPAGATFARLAGQYADIALLERRTFTQQPQWPGKCCGGLLAPEAQRSLASMGLTLPLHVLVDPQIFAVRTIDLAVARERYYPRSYINIDRERFDRWLLSMLPDRVARIFGASCQQILRREDGYLVTYRQGGEQRQLLARAVVGADGGYSLVRRTFFPDRPIRRYAAVQEWYPDREGSPFYGAVFDAQLTDCYGWLISKEGWRIVGGAFPLHRAAERFRLMRDKLAARGLSLQEPVHREGCLVCRPALAGQFCTGRDGIFLLGEAAGFISPSSLQGISYALDSGRLLAEALSRGLQGAEGRYRQMTLPLRGRLVGKLAKNPVLYTPGIRRAILASGVGSMAVACPSPAEG